MKYEVKWKTPDENGESEISVRAEDADGAAADQTFNVTVNAVNDAPTSWAMPDITVSITDTEEKALNYICVGIATYTDNFIKNGRQVILILILIRE